jgi:IclR family pca regulon transcriptional regulator
MDAAAQGIDRRDLIEGLGKGLRVIECFDSEHVRMATTEVAERAGLTRTAARRYLLSLVHYGYAETDGRLFWLQPRVLRLGQSYLSAARLPRLVQPFIQRASMQTGETVNFSVLDGHDIVYLARSNPPRFVSIGYQVGTRVPAHAVAPGYVLLSRLGETALARWIADHEFASFTPHTPVDRSRFRDQVQSARELGYWASDRLLDPGLRGVALPLGNLKGETCGALGMTVQLSSYDDEGVLSSLLPALRQVASELRPLL